MVDPGPAAPAEVDPKLAGHARRLERDVPGLVDGLALEPFTVASALLWTAWSLAHAARVPGQDARQALLVARWAFGTASLALAQP